MIRADKSVVSLEGSAQELSIELTYIIAGFKESMMKEFNMDEEQAIDVINKFSKIAFMNNIQRKLFLDKLEVEQEHE